MRGKPIKIEKVKGGYHIFVNDVPIVQADDGKNQDIDRVKANLKHGKNYKAPKSTAPFLITKASLAMSMAHQIGRYMLQLGDFVSGYTELAGITPEAQEAWWTKAIGG